MGIFSKKEDRSVANQQPIEDMKQSIYDLLVANGGGEKNAENWNEIQSIQKVINLAIAEFNKYDLILVQYLENETKKFPNSELTKFWKRPNNLMNDNEFKLRLLIDFLIYGKAYIEIKRGFVNGEYVTVNAEYVSQKLVEKMIKPNGDYYFEVQQNNMDTTGIVSSNAKRHEVSRYNMIEIINPMPFFDNNKDLIRDILQYNELNIALFKNGGLPTGVLETEGKLNRDIAERLKSAFERLYTGTRNAGKTIVLEEGIKYKQISQDPDKLSLAKKKLDLDQRVADAFGIDREFLTGGTITFEMEERFENMFLDRIFNYFISAFNFTLLGRNEISDGYETLFDKTSSQELSTRKINKWEKLIKIGAVSINQAKDMVGLPKLKGEFGDCIKVNQSENFFDPKTGKVYSFNSMQGFKYNEGAD